uniref:Uncharacterized protein n=1 Tax=Ceratitis capitata TaxID=7213 RepID=W8CBG4_CERCA
MYVKDNATSTQIHTFLTARNHKISYNNFTGNNTICGTHLRTFKAQGITVESTVHNSSENALFVNTLLVDPLNFKNQQWSATHLQSLFSKQHWNHVTVHLSALHTPFPTPS